MNPSPIERLVDSVVSCTLCGTPMREGCDCWTKPGTAIESQAKGRPAEEGTTPPASQSSPQEAVDIPGGARSPLSHEDEEIARLTRVVAGCIRSTIEAHGPITKRWVGSAAKRIAAQLVKGDTNPHERITDA